MINRNNQGLLAYVTVLVYYPLLQLLLHAVSPLSTNQALLVSKGDVSFAPDGHDHIHAAGSRYTPELETSVHVVATIHTIC